MLKLIRISSKFKSIKEDPNLLRESASQLVENESIRHIREDNLDIKLISSKSELRTFFHLATAPTHFLFNG